MQLSKSAHSAETVINSLSRSINTVGMGVLVVMMLFTVIDVFLRYVFRKPITGSLELTEYLMVAVVYLAVAWCAVKKGHVKVDLLVSRFSPRVQAIFDSITYLSSLGVCSLITWRGFVEFRDTLLVHRVSTILGIPAYPFHLVLTIGCTVLCLVLVANLVQFVVQAVKK